MSEGVVEATVDQFKSHPLLWGGVLVVVVGGLFLLTRGSSAAPQQFSFSMGPSDAQVVAGTNLQIAQVLANAQTAKAQSDAAVTGQVAQGYFGYLTNNSNNALTAQQSQTAAELTLGVGAQNEASFAANLQYQGLLNTNATSSAIAQNASNNQLRAIQDTNGLLWAQTQNNNGLAWAQTQNNNNLAYATAQLGSSTTLAYQGAAIQGTLQQDLINQQTTVNTNATSLAALQNTNATNLAAVYSNNQTATNINASNAAASLAIDQQKATNALTAYQMQLAAQQAQAMVAMNENYYAAGHSSQPVPAVPQYAGTQ